MFYVLELGKISTNSTRFRVHQSNIDRRNAKIFENTTTLFEMLDKMVAGIHLTSVDAADLKADWMYCTNQEVD
jgi:hypothetical protein